MYLYYCILSIANEDPQRQHPLLWPGENTHFTKAKFSKRGFTITTNLEEGMNIAHESYLGIKFKVQRSLSTSALQYYLPSAAIVLVSHISFIIPLSAIPGRIGLLATLFLTLINLFINHMVGVYKFIIMSSS